MLCRNKVANYAKWKRGFDAHTAAHREAGLKLVHLWRDVDDSNNVFFLFEVSSMKKAKAFIGAPEAAEAGKKFGVLDGEIHFIDEHSTKQAAKRRTKQ
jgi:hypothetical protein